MTKIKVRRVLLGLVLCMIIALPACEEQGPAEKAGEQIDEAAEEAKEKLSEVGEDVQEAVKEGGEKLEEAGEKMQNQ